MAIIDLKTKTLLDTYECADRFLAILSEASVKEPQKWSWTCTEIWKLAAAHFGFEYGDFAEMIMIMLRRRLLRLKPAPTFDSYGQRVASFDFHYMFGERAAKTVPIPSLTQRTAVKQ